MFICTIFTLQAWIILKNNHETTYTNWGKKNYKLWLIIITIIVIIIVNCLFFSLHPIYTIVYYMCPVFLFVSICFLLIVHLKLDKLDQSGNYNFSISELRKLKSYISLFIFLWVNVFFFFI